MKEPWFWRDEGVAASAMRMALAPAAALYDAAARIRVSLTKTVEVGAPVICIGNATMGGSGKTPFAIALQELLSARGVRAHFATRGYGGSAEGPLRVEPYHTFFEVGDEAILLASNAPTFVAKNRAAGARAAASGADVVIMDDGFQNPTLVKHCSFLLVDGRETDDSVFPAGRLREPYARALDRADAIASRAGSRPQTSKPWFGFRSEIKPPATRGALLAFCGIARPRRFFDGLREAGLDVVEEVAFADHHIFTDGEIAALVGKSKRLAASLVTTEKDFVRLPDTAKENIQVARLRIAIEKPEELAAFALARCGLPN